MDFTILAPAYFNSMQYVHYLEKSAEILGIEIHWYGQGHLYSDWMQVQVYDLRVQIEGLKTSHILYTDARDAFFVESLHTIKSRYLDMGAPAILISEERAGVNAGGWIADRTAAIEAIEVLASLDSNSGDPTVRWRQALREEKITASVDYKREIFRIVEGEKVTRDTSGCIMHFAGGYSDPRTGKDYLMEPAWREMWPLYQS